VCPVDCFYEGPNFIVINPDECIDCAVCVPECPVEAIISDSETETKDYDYWLQLNKDMSKKWPNISKKKLPLDRADEFRTVTEKKQFLDLGE